MSELTVSAGAVRALLNFACTKGASRSALISRSGIDPSELEDRDNRIPIACYIALTRAGQQLCNDPALALHFGESVDVSEFSFAHQISARSMMEAFEISNRYARLTVEVDESGGDRYKLSRIGGQLWMIDTRSNPNEFPELTESGFARMVCTTRSFIDLSKIVKSIHFTHAEPSYRAEYDRIFRVPLVFKSDRNGFLLDDAIMSIKPPPVAAYASEVLTSKAEELLEKLETSKSTRARVERILIDAFRTSDVGMESVASKLGVSRQTLFRRLKSEDVTFERVLDELRHKMALQYLNDGKASISQISHTLGFSDPAAFSRAFKRWTGTSPRARRE